MDGQHSLRAGQDGQIRLGIRDSVRIAAHRLRAAGISAEEADLDARLLAQFVLGWTAERFLIDATAPATREFSDAYDPLVERRAAREPYAYIVGVQEFWGLDFDVTPAVLIPRPETELIVESALGLVPPSATAAIADVGTGSGCLAVMLARERPQAAIVATDISEPALAVARRNAARHRTADRITFLRTHLLEEPAGTLFDLIVSNPPYVRESDRRGIQPEVRYEPAHALFAGDDGLDVIRELVPHAAPRLKPGGALVFEFGFGQAEAVAQLISGASGLTMVGLRRDLQDIPRVAIAKRAG